MSVFFIHSTDIVDGVVKITDPLLNHLSKSLRTKSGDFLLFNDEQRRRYHTTVVQITKHILHATIQQVEDHPCSTHPPLILAQAILKGEKMGWVIQKATELGVSAIVPLATDRVILRLSEKQEDTHQARWRRIALEAAQQSERWTLPTIFPLQTFQQFLETGIVQNIGLLALKSEKEPQWTSENEVLNQYLQQKWEVNFNDDLPILTDDYAPVDYYLMNTI